MSYYGVKAGRKQGVYATWSEAEEQVKGYSGAVFKKFQTEQEAKAYVYGGSAEQSGKRKYYAVAGAGVFEDWSLVSRMVQGVKGARYKGFKERSDAEAWLSQQKDDAYSAGGKKQAYYGVKAGRVTGVFEDWSAVQDAIAHYPNALYRKFKTKEEAEAYLL